MLAPDRLAQSDPEVWNAIRLEYQRQEEHVELIASENYASAAVLAAQGTALTNKYAEGYPGKRYYGGCAFVDVAEHLAIERAKLLFGAQYANVQPHSGSQANQAVYLAFLKPGDTILGMSLAHGGHLTHGAAVNSSGKLYHAVSYGLDRDEVLDYAEAEKLALEHNPRVIVAGASAYSLAIDWQRLRHIADEIDAILMADIAHYAGLVAAGLYPSPVGIAHVVTSTTHKTLRGPRGGMILAEAEHERVLNSAVFPGLQGGPLMHVIAAKAVAFAEALRPDFRSYQEKVVANAKTMAATLQARGLRIVSGRTECHLFLVDLRAKQITGKDAEEALGRAGITLNKNAIPNDPQKPTVTSGIRIGTPAMTTRGFGEAEAREARSLDRRCARGSRRRRHHAARRRGDQGALRSASRSTSMKCPFCGSDDTQVVDTRANLEANTVRRRRKCVTCEKRFTTYERVDLKMPRLVKKDGSRTDFDRDKLMGSMMLALRKRPVSTDAVDEAVDRVIERLRSLGEREVPTNRVGDFVMRELAKLDKIAYIRFASVYRSFETSGRLPRGGAGSARQAENDASNHVLAVRPRHDAARARTRREGSLHHHAESARRLRGHAKAKRSSARAGTSSAGGPHAEVVALEKAAGAASGATVYVSLEPCNHQGRTPPCVDALKKAKVKRVVAAMRDPEPEGGAGGARRCRPPASASSTA